MEDPIRQQETIPQAPPPQSVEPQSEPSGSTTTTTTTTTRTTTQETCSKKRPAPVDQPEDVRPEIKRIKQETDPACGHESVQKSIGNAGQRIPALNNKSEAASPPMVTRTITETQNKRQSSGAATVSQSKITKQVVAVAPAAASALPRPDQIESRTSSIPVPISDKKCPPNLSTTTTTAATATASHQPSQPQQQKQQQAPPSSFADSASASAASVHRRTPAPQQTTATIATTTADSNHQQSPMVSSATPSLTSSVNSTSSLSTGGVLVAQQQQQQQQQQHQAAASSLQQQQNTTAAQMLNLKHKYLAELEYMLREFRKLERQLLGAKGNAIEETPESRERREKLHSFILHLEDTIRQLQTGNVTLDTANGEDVTTTDVQTLEEHILANLLPVKNRLKKQLAAQQGATRNPAGIPTSRRGLLPSGAATFAAAAEQKRKQAEAAAEESQFGKPLSGNGSSLTQKLHGSTLGSQNRIHGHGVGTDKPPPTPPPQDVATASTTEETTPRRKVLYAGMAPGSEQIQSGVSAAAGVHNMVIETPGLIQTQKQPPPQAQKQPDPTPAWKTTTATATATATTVTSSNIAPAAAASVPVARATTIAKPAAVAVAPSVQKQRQQVQQQQQQQHQKLQKPAPPPRVAPATPAPVATPAPKPAPTPLHHHHATTAKMAAVPRPAVTLPVQPKRRKIYDDPKLSEEERRKLRKERRRRKKKRDARRRERERQRQLFAQHQTTHRHLKKGKLVMKLGKKKGPRSVEYICALCSETYNSACEYNPWWALTAHDCPKCRKNQVPRVDIAAPANAIEYHPALLAHADDPNDSGAAHAAASHLMHRSLHASARVGPMLVPPIESDEESDLSELSDDPLSDGSVVHASEEEVLSLTPAERAENENFGKEYTGPKLTPCEASRLLVLMSHASTCPGKHASAKHLDVCNSVKFLMLHARDCPGTTASFDICPFPWCRKVKHLMYHLVTCPRPKDCAICSPITLSPNLKSLIGLNDHRRKKQQERMKAAMAAAAAAAAQSANARSSEKSNKSSRKSGGKNDKRNGVVVKSLVKTAGKSSVVVGSRNTASQRNTKTGAQSSKQKAKDAANRSNSRSLPQTTPAATIPASNKPLLNSSIMGVGMTESFLQGLPPPKEGLVLEALSMPSPTIESHDSTSHFDSLGRVASNVETLCASTSSTAMAATTQTTTSTSTTSSSTTTTTANSNASTADASKIQPAPPTVRLSPKPGKQDAKASPPPVFPQVPAVVKRDETQSASAAAQSTSHPSEDPKEVPPV